MELTLPTKVNVTHPIMLDTKILVVIGANGAGKSSFGRDLLERYAGQAKRISGIHALFISDDESKLSASNEFARLQSMIKERLFMPRISEYEKLILQLQSEELILNRLFSLHKLREIFVISPFLLYSLLFTFSIKS